MTTLHALRPILGIDIGRVIIGGGPDGPEDTTFLNGSEVDSLATPPMEGALEAIRDLAVAFDGRVWLVSKAGPKIQARTRVWLSNQAFFQTTGVPSEQLRFCRERREKAAICARLGVTHFVDDRIDVLNHMLGIVPRLYLFGGNRGGAPAGIEWVRDWKRARAALIHQGETVDIE